MAPPITDAEFRKAIDLHALSAGLTVSWGEQDGKKRALLDPGGVVACLKDGAIACNSTTTRDALRLLIVEMRSAAKEEAESARRSNVPARRDEAKGDDFDLDRWRKSQGQSYQVAGKEAPNAFSVSGAANKQGLCTQIMDAGRSPTLVWGHVRVTDPRTGQYREDRVSHEKETFCLLKAWEDASAMQRKMPGLIIGICESNMPELDPEKRVKGMPAGLWLTMQVMRSWSMADRDAVTKAERRAQLKLMNREWRDEGEISLESEEETAVREARR